MLDISQIISSKLSSESTGSVLVFPSCVHIPERYYQEDTLGNFFKLHPDLDIVVEIMVIDGSCVIP